MPGPTHRCAPVQKASGPQFLLLDCKSSLWLGIDLSSFAKPGKCLSVSRVASAVRRVGLLPSKALGLRSLIAERSLAVGTQTSRSERILPTYGSIAWCFLLNMSLTKCTGYQFLVMGLIIQEGNHTNCCKEVVSWFARIPAALRFWRAHPSILMTSGHPLAVHVSTV